MLSQDIHDTLQVRELHAGDATSVGNEPCVRTWLGDVESIPAFQGPFDAALFNAVFGNIYDQREALLRTCLLLRPGKLNPPIKPLHPRSPWKLFP